MKNKQPRSVAFGWVILAYGVALIAAFLTGWVCLRVPLPLIYSVLIADVVGTLVIFAFSYYFDNSSFYDPYWSVIPIFLAACLLWLGKPTEAVGFRGVLLLIAVTVWGIRLTRNWARTWPGLHHQDWRYVDLQKQHGKWYWLVSFSGIHLFPTLLVFLACLPFFPAMMMPGNPLNGLDLLAFAVALGGTWIEAAADRQLLRFRLERKDYREVMTRGLWAYSRHPNYLGEITFWWGIFLFGLAARPDYWWTGVGAVCITLLFEFISIPMIEKRMVERRPQYRELTAGIPKWLPIAGRRAPKRS